jgi:hypothetical protein
LCSHFPLERGRIDEVDESALAVELDDREPLSIGRLELRVARDVDLFEGRAAPEEDGPGTLAEVAALCVVEDDPRDRSRA